MNKPSERIVVFVTPAQKRAISASADELGISISELMRRAVLAFGATSDQVKAASIVDRLNAPREPDALAQVLRKAAKPLRERRASPLRPAVTVVPREEAGLVASPVETQDEVALTEATAERNTATTPAETQASTAPSVVAAGHDVSSTADEVAQVAARLNTPTPPDAAHAIGEEPFRSPSVAPATRARRSRRDADAYHDERGGAPENGKFA
ncbi:plasmid mobilization protein [Paraburkholderia dinghuensis]|uniref:Ribbon-helix-helix protein, CopG family n=1 Tax=Paraburkholderia dinghuensis TaxID=2305225 RepID=A0A3N6MW56_9BURK|nr:hypothetical protein [Paraburkholderia dinghuensis]RQH07979.1 hypothetical protein D1Y85_07705 [Paraburkholderia dinghuensis]